MIAHEPRCSTTDTCPACGPRPTVPRQARRLSPVELDAARRELAAADPAGDYRTPTGSTPTRGEERVALAAAALLAFWGTVILAAIGDGPWIRGIGVFAGMTITGLLVVLAFLGDGQ